MTAERRIDALYKTIYLSKRIGETYPATVSSVTRFGAFAALANTCEGLIPLTAFPGMWTFDEGNLMLRSSSGETLRLGDRITVSVDEADITRGKVTFGLVALPEGATRALPPDSAPTRTPVPTLPTRPTPRAGKSARDGAGRPTTRGAAARDGKPVGDRPRGGKAQSGGNAGGKRNGGKPGGNQSGGRSGGQKRR